MQKVRDKVKSAKKAALELASLPVQAINKALLQAANAIDENRDRILEANKKDIEKANELLEKGEYSEALVHRLKLSESKIDSIVKMVKSVAKLDDPLGRTLSATELDDGLELYKVSCPIGVIGSIFESRPDVLTQISSLCLKSGNSIILKGGSEAKNSNEVLFGLFRKATEESGVPEGWIQLIEARSEVRELLELDEDVDLLVPRGSKEFIKYIQENTRIPVLGHAEGVCHIYVDKDADLEKALKVCYDGKVQYPAVCNAAETLLVHRDIASELIPPLRKKYEDAGVEVRGCNLTREILEDIKEASEEDWSTEYLDLTISIKIVDDLDQAVNHVNTYGSKHTDAIISENGGAISEFLSRVDSSSVMANASTRFSDGYRYGLGAEVGISTGKIHARGPVGLEGLTTTKYYLIGNGHIVDTYVGPNARKFTHKKLSKEWSQVKKALEEK
ncbi:MAG: glutamate-5-semialdehyde dehydrogenase [Candidatus Hadarchaeota archaeon]|nr:glutamate-5-semialdehyde dehydrogenase [Candidatus Hadarchaeota archaeon]